MPDSGGIPSRDRLVELVDAMAGQPVVMCVDLVSDRFITGTPKRISREAPVLILSHEGERFVPGGGANAVANVAALGGQPLPLGVVGADVNGRELVSWLEEIGVPQEGIVQIDGYATPTKVRILGGGKHSIKQQIVRYDIEDRLEPGAEIRDQFRAALEGWRGRARLAVLSDYGYGAVQPDMVSTMRSALAAEGIVLCDSRYRLADFEGVDGATPNEEEAEALADHAFNDDRKRLVESGRRLLDGLGTRFLLITRGSRGMTLFENGSAAHIPIHGSDQVADVTGAGDTVIGTFALALAAGGSPVEAALLANFAGGLVVQKLGTATTTPDELRGAINSGTDVLTSVVWDEF